MEDYKTFYYSVEGNITFVVSASYSHTKIIQLYMVFKLYFEKLYTIKSNLLFLI